MKHLTLCGDVFVVNPECVAGAASDHPHRTRPADVREPLAVPRVHWDYCFPQDADRDHHAVVLDMEWVTEQAARDLLRFWIRGDVIFESDQGPAIVAVLKEIATLKGPRRTMLEVSPVGDSKSNGVAERAIQNMEKLMRVQKLSI